MATIEKLCSPIFVQAFDKEIEELDDCYDEFPYFISQETAVHYADEIQAALDRDSSDLDEVRGLMEYFYDNDPDIEKTVNEKVRSLFVGVEVHEGKLWGVATIERTEPLTLAEYDRLKDYISGQYADGFGEGFEQRPIKVGHEELYVSLWSHEDSFFIDTQREFNKRLGIEPTRPDSDLKQIRFIDPQYTELFRIPDGGSILVTRPMGEMYPGVQEQWVGICKYLDDYHVSINGECYDICQFAEIQQRIGATVMPEPEPEVIGGFRVSHRTFVRDLVFKLGHNPDAVHPYGTWRCNKADPGNNYWGHYWADRSTALTDFLRRADAARTDTPYDHTVLMRQEQKPSLRDTLKQNAERSKAEFGDQPSSPKKFAEMEI